MSLRRLPNSASIFYEIAINNQLRTTTKQIWPKYDTTRTKNILHSSRNSIYILTAIITVHWTYREHVLKKGLPYINICCSRMLEGITKSFFHLLCKCSALTQIRDRILGTHKAPNLVWLSTKNITDIGVFIETTKWFERIKLVHPALIESRVSAA